MKTPSTLAFAGAALISAFTLVDSADATPQWRLLNNGPGRSGAAAQFDYETSLVYVTGGHDASSVLASSYKILTFATCNDLGQPFPAMPYERHGHSMVFHRPSNKLYVLGGAKNLEETELLLDVISLDVGGTQWTDVADEPDPVHGMPPARINAAAVLISGPRIVLFGGRDSTSLLGDTWMLDLSTLDWSKLDLDPCPIKMESPTLVLDNLGETAFLFGGRNDGGDALNDLWEFSVEYLNWSERTPSPPNWPPARFGHVAVVNDENQMIVFGGAYQNGTGQIVDRGDAWTLDCEAGSWTETSATGTPPGPRRGAAAAYGKYLDRMVLTGGVSGTATYPGELWELSFSDHNAPAAIDMYVTLRSSCSIVFGWTAVGDDCDTGTATSYDFRYSQAPITAENFHLATQVSIDSPSPAGSPECAVVGGLAASTTYHFSVKAVDEVGHTSPYGGDLEETTRPSQCQNYLCGLSARTPRVESGTTTMTRLLPPVPNPSRHRVALSYTVASDEDDEPLELNVFDVRGARVRSLRKGPANVGEHRIEWDFRTDSGERVAPGVYIVRMVLGAFSAWQTVIALQSR